MDWLKFIVSAAIGLVSYLLLVFIVCIYVNTKPLSATDHFQGWKKIEDFVGSKGVIQIRSHAQKYFLKVQKNGTITHVPPPRPKCKAAHSYPQKNILMPLLGSILVPGYALWDDTPLFINTASNKIMPLRDGLAANLQGTQDLGSNGVLRVGRSGVSEMQKPGQEATILNHGNFYFPSPPPPPLTCV